MTMTMVGQTLYMFLVPLTLVRRHLRLYHRLLVDFYLAQPIRKRLPLMLSERDPYKRFGTNMPANLPNSQLFMSSKYLDLKALAKLLGEPARIITLTQNDNWLELFKIHGVHFPVEMVEAFCQRFEGFMDRFIRTENNVFGRDEERAPKEQKISAEIPRFKDPNDPTKPHPMNDLWREAVLKTQIHHCIHSRCLRGPGGTRFKNCKYGFPFALCSEELLDKTGIRYEYLRSDIEDVSVSPYVLELRLGFCHPYDRTIPLEDFLTNMAPSQRSAFTYATDKWEAGQQVRPLITGGAGVGKSYLLKALVVWLRDRHITFAKCATTGIAAHLIGGHTVHSFLGMDFEFKSRIQHGTFKRKRSQLQAVGKHIWREDQFSIFQVVVLREVKRQSDTPFIELLNRMRLGNLTDADMQMLATRLITREKLIELDMTRGAVLFPFLKEKNAYNVKCSADSTYPTIGQSTREANGDVVTSTISKEFFALIEKRGRIPAACFSMKPGTSVVSHQGG
ncbi:hypothetical protein BV898_10323 [Hypsibius exemplaris]|uniref:ATP-dependent DNA helicase n=1 Tax=Hypsibius exemplaris TaxID=2072580 RepID=A0A1W0WJP7_HYPEX|nr:hypothetical protein BV898_10323 [Hypsibius exemplaris]